MAALSRPTEATYTINESVTVDTTGKRRFRDAPLAPDTAIRIHVPNPTPFNGCMQWSEINNNLTLIFPNIALNP